MLVDKAQLNHLLRLFITVYFSDPWGFWSVIKYCWIYFNCQSLCLNIPDYITFARNIHLTEICLAFYLSPQERATSYFIFHHWHVYSQFAKEYYQCFFLLLVNRCYHSSKNSFYFRKIDFMPIIKKTVSITLFITH